jgi:hypothetical protein
VPINPAKTSSPVSSWARRNHDLVIFFCGQVTALVLFAVAMALTK